MQIDGIVDFSEAEPYDCEWKNKLDWLVEGYYNRIRIEDRKDRLSISAGMLSTNSTDWFNKKQDEAFEIYNELRRLRYPGSTQEKESSEFMTQDANDLKKIYREAWGIDVDSKEGQDAIRKVLDYYDSLSS